LPYYAKQNIALRFAQSVALHIQPYELFPDNYHDPLSFAKGSAKGYARKPWRPFVLPFADPDFILFPKATIEETSKQYVCFPKRKQRAETNGILGIVYVSGDTASYSAPPSNRDKGSKTLAK